jgi:chromosomal replication initiator protein
MIFVAQIQQAIASEYGIPVELMREPAPCSRSKANVRDVAHPRQAAMALSVLLTNQSYERIGFYFGGRDHTTVRHAASAVAKRRKTDARLHNAMRRVTLELVRR